MTSQCPICNSAISDGASACPVCGFHVLESTQSFKPVPLDGIEVAPKKEAAQQFELRVVRGPQTGIDIPLHAGTLSMGRDPRCDVFLNDMTVSRAHATLEVGAGGCVLRDTNSYNGVWVNNRPVDTCLLKSGDTIQIGAFCLLYRESM